MANNESTRYIVNSVHEYKDRDGKERSQFTRVGSAWTKTSRDGEPLISIELTPGLAVSGKLVCFLPKEKDDEEDKRSRSDRRDDPPRGRR
jgi:uncharacterized protein (DUF736 family)